MSLPLRAASAKTMAYMGGWKMKTLLCSCVVSCHFWDGVSYTYVVEISVFSLLFAGIRLYCEKRLSSVGCALLFCYLL